MNNTKFDSRKVTKILYERDMLPALRKAVNNLVGGNIPHRYYLYNNRIHVLLAPTIKWALVGDEQAVIRVKGLDVQTVITHFYNSDSSNSGSY